MCVKSKKSEIKKIEKKTSLGQHFTSKRWFSRYVIAAMLVDGKQKNICSFHHCYLCLPRLHENHLYGTSSLNLPCMWVGLSSYQSVVINGELTSKADPSYFLLPPGLCWWLASWISDIKNCVDMKIKSACLFTILPEQCCESKQWFSYVNLW